MAAKDKGADTFDALGAGAIDDGVDHAGPSLHYSNEFPYVPMQKKNLTMMFFVLLYWKRMASLA